MSYFNMIVNDVKSYCKILEVTKYNQYKMIDYLIPRDAQKYILPPFQIRCPL